MVEQRNAESLNTEYPKLEGTHTMNAYSSVYTGPSKNQAVFLRLLSKCFFNSSKLHAIAKALGCLSEESFPNTKPKPPLM